MNKQYKGAGKRGIEWTDYTWNPIAGCFHACQWTMPDGSVANCYAEDVATRVAGSAYPQGFEHHYWKPSALKEPGRVKTGSRIFVGSMADVFGHWVPGEQITQVIEVARQNPQHTFQFLTKNPLRTLDFELPANAWIGASSPPDFMWNKTLTTAQKQRMLNLTLERLAKVKTPVRWMSFEPLSWDVAALVEKYPGAIQWAVIGAASNGKKLYAPDLVHVQNLIEVLDAQGVKVFFKGNLRSLAWATGNWREDFAMHAAA